MLTIGMPSYKNAEQVWWTIQSLRMYQDLTDCEILVIDNFGDDALRDWCSYWSNGVIRYVKFTDKQGTAIAKEQVFKNAREDDFVLCIDSHIMFSPGSITKLKEWIKNNKNCPDLIHGVMLYDNLVDCVDRMEQVWRDEMFGIWGRKKRYLPETPYEIPMHGGGCVGCFKNQWLHYNEEFKGFGGEEGYIHMKYKQAGRKILCLPFLKWAHRFYDEISKAPYSLTVEEKIRNYLIGFLELGVDTKEVIEHFKDFDIKIEEEPENKGNISERIAILRK